jgi:predicted transcriptional regulator
VVEKQEAKQESRALAGSVTVTVASVMGVIALVGFTDAGAAVTFIGPVLLYNRLNRGATFENPTRRRIFEYVKTMPGACIADIAQQVGVSHSTASYHLDKLCGFSLVTSNADGNKVRFFVNGGAFTEDERRVLSALDNVETRRVLAVIIRHPWSYRAELTALLNVSSPTVNWHLERLTGCGLVLENKSGRNRFLFADKTYVGSALQRLVDKLRDTGYDASGLEALVEACREA